MRKSPLILLLFALFFTGCAAQELAADPPIEVSATFHVLSISGNQATIHNKDHDKTFKIDRLNLQEEWEYFFILNVEKCSNCKIKNATVRFHNITPAQANANIKEGLRLYRLANTKNPKG